jgi:hypothetical protein
LSEAIAAIHPTAIPGPVPVQIQEPLAIPENPDLLLTIEITVPVSHDRNVPGHSKGSIAGIYPAVIPCPTPVVIEIPGAAPIDTDLGH